MRRVKATKLNAPFFPRSVSRNKTEVNAVDGVNETARDRRLKRMAARDAEVHAIIERITATERLSCGMFCNGYRERPEFHRSKFSHLSEGSELIYIFRKF